MQRTVPRISTDPIALYMRTYYSLLRTTDAIPIQSLVESYLAMDSSLHVQGRNNEVDISALIYTGLRLPSCITQVDLILMGQTEDVFENYGFPVGDWERVNAPGRRRRTQWNSNGMLAMFISSRSDIDDIIPMLTAYQIEWNKVHERLRYSPFREHLEQDTELKSLNDDEFKLLADLLGVRKKDLARWMIALDSNFFPTLRSMMQHRKQFRMRLLAGSLADYRKATARWYANVRDSAAEAGYDMGESPIYFISSNMHSVVNLLTGFAVQQRERILNFLHEHGQSELLREYEAISADGEMTNNEPNFLYYALKKFISVHPQVEQEQHAAEADIGIVEIPAKRGFDIGAQVMPLNRLNIEQLDPRLHRHEDFNRLRDSKALVVNIDYPLGMSAYDLLTHLAARVGRLMGVYVMGKAATLNGRIGDVMVPHVVHDEHSNNTYLFNNVFSARQIAPFMTLGSVLDNQKAVTAFGTFLQNPSYMDVFYQEGYTIIEMEAGPYLSASYESVRPRRHPDNEIVRLYEAPLDIGIIHYASDTPFSKGHNLGAGSLSYAGIEPTYAAAIAILNHIFRAELNRLKVQRERAISTMEFSSNGR